MKGELGVKALATALPSLRCPNGHTLPHRMHKLRCSVLDCCAEGEDLKSKAEGLLEASRTTSLLDEASAQLQALDEAWPVPEVPRVTSVQAKLPAKEFMRQRLENVAPAMLERRIRVAALDPGAAGKEAQQELLDRAGYTRNPEPSLEFNGPVLIMAPRELGLKYLQEREAKVIQGTVVPREEKNDG